MAITLLEVNLFIKVLALQEMLSRRPRVRKAFIGLKQEAAETDQDNTLWEQQGKKKKEDEGILKIVTISVFLWFAEKSENIYYFATITP